MMNAAPTPAGATRSPATVCLLLLLLPLIAYAAMMIEAISMRLGIFPFGRLDWAVLMVVLAYCGGVIFLAWRRFTHWAQLLTCLYSFLLAAAACEVILRVWFPLPENVPWLPMRHVAAAAETLPGGRGEIVFTVNALGVRGRPVRLENVDLRILCVGGSTTECGYLPDKQTWPWLLQDKLARSLGKAVFVGNAGITGQFSLHHDYLLKHYSLAPRFEWVVLLVGGNDLTTLVLRHDYEERKKNVEATTLANSPHHRHVAYQNLIVTRRLTETYHSLMNRLTWKSTAQWVEDMKRQRQQLLKSNPIADVPYLELQHGLAIYRANLHNIITTCQRNKQHLVIMTQPQIYRPDLPEELARMTWSTCDHGAYTADALAEMMAAFNQDTIAVCKQRQVDYIDLAAMLPKDATVFSDHEHFNASGCEKVSDIVCAYFTAKLKPQHL